MTETSDASPPAPAAARRRGRPRKLDEARCSKICAMVSIGCSLRQAAQAAGCSYPTLRREALRLPEFRETLRQARRNQSRISALRFANPEVERMLSAFAQKVQNVPTGPRCPPDNL